MLIGIFLDTPLPSPLVFYLTFMYLLIEYRKLLDDNFYHYYLCRIVAILLLSLYMCLLYGLHVPNWEFQAPSLNMFTNGSHAQIVS